MKRILIAGLLAVGIHGLLLKMEFGWLQTRSFEKPLQQPFSITLAVRQPQPQDREVKHSMPVVSEKPSLNKPVKKKTTPRTTKSPRQKSTKPSVRPLSEKRPAPGPQTASDPSRADAPTAMTPAPAMPTTEDTRVPPPQTMVEARPLYRVNPPPKYPAMARRRGYTGQVVLDVLVGRSGTVLELRVSTSSGYDMLDDAALAAVKTWVFEPGTRGRKKVKMWVRIPVRFELQ